MGKLKQGQSDTRAAKKQFWAVAALHQQPAMEAVKLQ
jgi:hypothetical protein